MGMQTQKAGRLSFYHDREKKTFTFEIEVTGMLNVLAVLSADEAAELAEVLIDSIQSVGYSCEPLRRVIQ